MPNSPLYYTVLDSAGEIVLSQITMNPNYPVGEGQRLVKDQTPDYDSLTQYMVRVNPVPLEQDYVEYQVKDIVYTDEELIETAIQKRLQLLIESDWTQLNDSPLSQLKIEEWKTYRQNLRDITAQSQYPKSILWPNRPE